MKNLNVHKNLAIVSVATILSGAPLAIYADGNATKLKCTCSDVSAVSKAVGPGYQVDCTHTYDIYDGNDEKVTETDAKVVVLGDDLITTYSGQALADGDANYTTFSIGPRDDETLQQVTDRNSGQKYDKDNDDDWHKNKLTEFTMLLSNANEDGIRSSHFYAKTSGKDYEGFVVVDAKTSSDAVQNEVVGACLENLGDEGNNDNHHSQ